MKKSLLYSFLLPTIVLSSCTNSSPMKQYIHDAGKVEVVLYNGTTPSVQYITNDVDKIQKWMTYISDSTTTSPADCNLEGRLTFVSGDDSLPMQFSMTNGCTYVHYTMKGKTFVQPLTTDGINYVNSLKKVF
jgi:hypothetical protein